MRVRRARRIADIRRLGPTQIASDLVIGPRRVASARVEDADLVAGRVAQVRAIERLTVRRPKTRRALVGSACCETGGVRGSHRVLRGRDEGDHDPVAAARGLPVERFAHADVTLAALQSVERPAALERLALAADRAKHAVVEGQSALHVARAYGDVADHGLAPLSDSAP